MKIIGHSVIPRFTIRDLLLLMVFVAISCAGFANRRQILAASNWLNDILSRQAAQVGPLLGGSRSIEPEWSFVNQFTKFLKSDLTRLEVCA
ncbi:MAG TPA: hypothetical protein VGI40_08930 [Pirellulaceae bacterium]|jgi:hypothetical protein